MPLSDGEMSLETKSCYPKQNSGSQKSEKKMKKVKGKRNLIFSGRKCFALICSLRSLLASSSLVKFLKTFQNMEQKGGRSSRKDLGDAFH